MEDDAPPLAAPVPSGGEGQGPDQKNHGSAPLGGRGGGGDASDGLKHPIRRSREALLDFATIRVGGVVPAIGTDPCGARAGADDAQQHRHPENLAEVIVSFASQSGTAKRIGNVRIDLDLQPARTYEAVVSAT